MIIASNRPSRIATNDATTHHSHIAAQKESEQLVWDKLVSTLAAPPTPQEEQQQQQEQKQKKEQQQQPHPHHAYQPLSADDCKSIAESIAETICSNDTTVCVSNVVPAPPEPQQQRSSRPDAPGKAPLRQHRRSVAGEEKEENDKKWLLAKQKKEQIVLLTHILLKYLQINDPDKHAEAKEIIRECNIKNQNNEKGYESLTAAVHVRLRQHVSEKIWSRANAYMQHHLQKREEEAQQQQKQQQQQQQQKGTTSSGKVSLKLATREDFEKYSVEQLRMILSANGMDQSDVDLMKREDCVSLLTYLAARSRAKKSGAAPSPS